MEQLLKIKLDGIGPDQFEMTDWLNEAIPEIKSNLN